MNSAPLISVDTVWRYYDTGRSRLAALRGINLSIEASSFVAVWGPSGSGKSTLCNLIGMVDTPTSGQVRINGKSTSDLSDKELSRHRNHLVGIVFQQFNLLPVLDAVENVMLPLQLQGISDRQARTRARNMLEEFGLVEFAHQRPDTLSGGQQQRVAVARALVTQPPLVIADEPTANLDSDNAMHIVELMRRYNRQHGTTFVLSTHDQRLLEHVGRRICLRDGTIAEDVHDKDGTTP